MKGWPRDVPFMNPSTMGTSLPKLRTLMHALQNGECAFHKLLPAEAAERKKMWEADVAAGRVVAKHRAERIDKGSSRKRAHDTDDEPDTNNPTERGPGDASDSTATVPPPAKKRARKSNATKSTGTAPRDDATTRAAVQRLANNRRVKSRTVIMSEDEMDDDPQVDQAPDHEDNARR